MQLGASSMLLIILAGSGGLSQSEIVVTIDPPTIIPKRKFVITITPIQIRWTIHSKFEFKSEFTMFFSYKPRSQTLLASNHIFHVDTLPGQPSFQIRGFMKDSEELRKVELSYMEEMSTVEVWKWYVMANSIADLEMKWDHLNFEKKFRPVAFENDVIKITCAMMAGEIKNRLHIFLPAQSEVMYREHAVSNFNYGTTYVRLTRDIYGMAVNCSVVGRPETLVNWEMLRFRFYEDKSPPYVQSSIYVAGIVTLISVYLVYMLLVAYVLVVRQRAIRTQMLVSSNVDKLQNNIFQTTMLPYNSTVVDVENDTQNAQRTQQKSRRKSQLLHHLGSTASMRVSVHPHQKREEVPSNIPHFPNRLLSLFKRPN